MRLTVGIDVAESAHEVDRLFPTRERMELRTVGLGKRLVEVGKYRHGLLTYLEI